MSNCIDCGSENVATFKDPKGKGGYSNRKRCKPCRSIHICRVTIEKAAKENPDRYLECDDCCNIQSKHYGEDKCLKCGSINLMEMNNDT